MGLVTNKDIMDKAYKGGYAVGAFNINNMEILQAIVSASEEKKSPVIIAASEGAIKYAGFEYLVSMVNTASETSSIPISLHLDHGKDMDLIKRCINDGFTSVMIDASKEEYDKNVEITAKVAEMAHAQGISVEAELGKLVGIEDNVNVAEGEGAFTDPEQAEDFVKKTGIDSLAVAIGTSHGAYKFKGEGKLDIPRLVKIKETTNMPLVLHGASGVPKSIVDLAQKYGAELGNPKGVPDDQIKEACKHGICKVNTDTDLRLSLTAAIRQVLSESPEVFDPRKIIGPARDLIKDTVSKRIDVFGSGGKA